MRQKLIYFFFNLALVTEYRRVETTDYGHPERAFFQKFETFGLGQTNWVEILSCIWGISGQTISTILALCVPCPLERVAGSLFYEKLWFSDLKHITPKCTQNKIWAVKNSGNIVHTSIFGVLTPSTPFADVVLGWSLWKSDAQLL